MLLHKKKIKIINFSLSEIFIISLAVLCFSYALFIALKYSSQVPLDNYSFRQTQTALTAFWLGKNGFSLAYETPVAGAPWSIPFEFPIYQYIVALVSQITQYSLDAIGRIISFLFLALCLLPVRSITSQLKLSLFVFYIFVALLFSSPLYLYWGRTFMIETTAVFFCITAIKFFIDIIQMRSSFKYSFLYMFFIVSSILQKATTGLPVLAILSLVYFYLSFKEISSSTKGKNYSTSIFMLKKITMALIYFGIPLLIGIIWTLYTDHVKELNGLGSNLTSSALSKWNWGTLDQRLSADLYSGVLWKRMFEQNLSGLIGAATLLFALFSSVDKSVKLIILISTSMGIVPLFLFTNLHIVHTYYQTANLVFLIYAVAVSIGHVLNGFLEKKTILLFIALAMVASNYFWFSKEYFNVVKTEFNKENSRDYAVAAILKREIPHDKYFVAFGNDWSSSLTYLAERKSFTVPGFFKEYEKISLNPEYFIEETHLGAVVLCPSSGNPTLNALSRWSSSNRSWKIGEVQGCYIATPEVVLVNTLRNIPSVECQGNIDFATVLTGTENKNFAVTGWTTILGEKGIIPAKVYVTLVKGNSEPIYFEALQVNRPDVSVHFGQPNDIDSGFSRIINTDSLTGKYFVGFARLNQGRLERCQIQKEISINSDGTNE